MFESIDLETSSKDAATAARDITFDTGRQFGESSTEFEDLVDHHGDGLWRRHLCPAVSNGGADEHRKNSRYIDFNRHELCVQELGRGRSSMGIKDGIPIYQYLAEVEVRGTDRLYRPDEHENVNTDRKEAQRKGHQVE